MERNKPHNFLFRVLSILKKDDTLLINVCMLSRFEHFAVKAKSLAFFEKSDRGTLFELFGYVLIDTTKPETKSN